MSEGGSSVAVVTGTSKMADSVGRGAIVRLVGHLATWTETVKSPAARVPATL